MDVLGLERPHVVGSSMGGAVAQELVLAHPHRIRSLILNGTWCRGDRFLHEAFRSWIWAPWKAGGIRDSGHALSFRSSSTISLPDGQILTPRRRPDPVCQ